LKLRNIVNLPVILEGAAEEIGLVEKVVVGDDFKLAYLVIGLHDSGQGIICGEDFMLGPEAILLFDKASIKSYAHGEESSIYDKKLGDTIYGPDGKELGLLSDFVINRDDKHIWGVELSSGLVKDILDGRPEIPLQEVRWASISSAMVNQEGSDSI